jgi:hypothetical protein
VGVVEPVGQAGGVGQQVPQQHRPGGPRAGRARGRVVAVDGQLGEGGDERRYRVLEDEGALLVQLHGRDRGDRLSHRVDAEAGIELDRQVGLQVTPAAGGQVHDPAPAADQDQPAA